MPFCYEHGNKVCDSVMVMGYGVMYVGGCERCILQPLESNTQVFGGMNYSDKCNLDINKSVGASADDIYQLLK